MIIVSNGIDWLKFRCNFIMRMVYKMGVKFKILRNPVF